MFETIGDEKPSPEDRKLFWLKACLVLAALAFAAGVGYFFAFQPYHK